MITKQLVAEKLLAYMQHQLSLPQLVAWAEDAYLDGDFPEADALVLSEILGKIGVADVDNFGLLWSDCDEMMIKLGYKIQVLATAA